MAMQPPLRGEGPSKGVPTGPRALEGCVTYARQSSRIGESISLLASGAGKGFLREYIVSPFSSKTVMLIKHSIFSL